MSDELEKMNVEEESTKISDETSVKLARNQVEKQEEAKLKAKYPTADGGHSAFLQKKLAKGTKYFDSGDYQMARQTLNKMPNKPRFGPSITQALLSTGEVIPTVESVPVRKTSIIQTKFQQPTPTLSAPPSTPSN